MKDNLTQDFANNIRRASLIMVHQAKASHIGSALSIADIVAVLYGEVMYGFAPSDDWMSRDRFILSKGHACVAVYAALAEVNLIERWELQTYGKNFSPLMNHISHKVCGVEFSTGSLGHGLPFGVGKSFAAKLSEQPWHTYVLVSDGEMNEGSNWEALMFAPHHRLDNITLIVDYNKLQSLGSVEDTLGIEPFAAKLNAFGWHVQEIDGHDHTQLKLGLRKRIKNKPVALIANTVKGKGVSFMENSIIWHYRNPNDAELALALAELELYSA